jgi:mannose-1-phosphate guanylyltransferase/mannose-1-phosphate guanylyltransferase/mannose-6-phosphate isomerase
MTITPILLCGGSGTRLWPLSRKSYPKQFTDILGEDSLFQASAKRFSGDGFAEPLIITGDSFRFIVTEQLDACRIAPAGVMIEPDGRNTAPAAIAAALTVAAADPDRLMLLVPSDHAVTEPDKFREAVLNAVPAAREGRIVTFGIAPTRPETGFGWLEAGAETHPGVHVLERFIEKPDSQKAQELPL